MAIVNGYATRAELQDRLFGDQTPSTQENSVMDAVIEAVSRAIDKATHRHFFQLTVTTRHFTAEWMDLLIVPDLVSVDASGLKTDDDGDRTYDETWAITDFDLLPFNASDLSEPYTRIEITPDGVKSFPAKVKKGVQIKGTWGWPAIPDITNEACLIQSARLFRRKDVPFGAVGSPEMGFSRIPKLDPDVEMLVSTLVRESIAAV